MGLLSIFKRKGHGAAAGAAASEPPEPVQEARTRARRRLIGAVVLVGVGVVGFPLVFETQPRPIPVDIPIEIPRKEGAPPLVMPAMRAPGAERSDTPAQALSQAPASAAVPHDEVITETRDDAAHATATATGSAPVAGDAQAAASGVASAPTPRPAPASAVAKPVQKPAEPKSPAAVSDGARAKALLEGKDPAAAPAPRYVVQVGAFADAAAAQEARAKAEKLGLKTYTQVAETTAGSRIRVRVGPFATRDDANKAQARARSAGLAAVILTL